MVTPAAGREAVAHLRGGFANEVSLPDPLNSIPGKKNDNRELSALIEVFSQQEILGPQMAADTCNLLPPLIAELL